MIPLSNISFSSDSTLSLYACGTVYGGRQTGLAVPVLIVCSTIVVLPGLS